jgi:hypothetical protein
MKNIYLILIFSLLFFGAVPIDKVSYKVPANWSLLEKSDTANLSKRLYLVKKLTINGEECYANAFFQCYPIPDSVGIWNADNITSAHTRGLSYLLSARDGGHWKTYLLERSVRGLQYLALDRFGTYDGWCFELLLVFPNAVEGKGGANDKQTDMKVLSLPSELVVDENMAGINCASREVREYVDQFNTVCESMKIEGQNEFNARAVLIDPPTDAKVYRDTTLTK